jgi:hypothetical protein
LQFEPTDNAETFQGIVSLFDHTHTKLFGGYIVIPVLPEYSIDDLLYFRNDFIGSKKPNAARDGVKRDHAFYLRVVICDMVRG